MENMENSHRPFEQLSIPRKAMDGTVSRYRIYKNASEFSLVEASTALEALSAAGEKNVYKIVRDDPMGYNLLRSEELRVTSADGTASPTA